MGVLRCTDDIGCCYEGEWGGVNGYKRGSIQKRWGVEGVR